MATSSSRHIHPEVNDIGRKVKEDVSAEALYAPSRLARKEGQRGMVTRSSSKKVEVQDVGFPQSEATCDMAIEGERKLLGIKEATDAAPFSEEDLRVLRVVLGWMQIEETGEEEGKEDFGWFPGYHRGKDEAKEARRAPPGVKQKRIDLNLERAGAYARSLSEYDVEFFRPCADQRGDDRDLQRLQVEDKDHGQVQGIRGPPKVHGGHVSYVGDVHGRAGYVLCDD